VSPRYPLVVGLIALAGWMAGLVLAAKAALLGWLVALFAFESVPIGCLAVLIMVILVPGTWRRLYTGPLLAGSALLPIAAVATIPVLLGLGALYSWTDPSVAAGFAPFKAAWLSSTFFILRQLVYWAILLGLWLGLMLLPFARAGIAAVGIIAYALAASWMGIDVAETLTPAFHSSIYGLIVLADQWIAAVAFGIALGAGAEKKPPGLAAAGALMVALLAWAYLHAMQFVVIWAGDLPDEVVWYLARGTHGWEFVTALLFLVQGFGPFFAMLSPSVRSSRTAMTGIALVTLAMRPVESAWLMLPQQQSGWLDWLLALVALLAMAGLGAAAIAALRARRPAWFDGERYFPKTPDSAILRD
jgi:hypothetical protein